MSEVLLSIGNLGADPPTGSRDVFHQYLANLNAGMGEPCAGQVKLNGLRARRSIPEVFASEENFGVEPPTGSESGARVVER